MTVDAEGSWSGRAGARAVEFAFDGPTIAACLARAVECFADAVADVHPSAVGDEHPVVLHGATPSALLLAVLEECLRCGLDGRVAIGFVAGASREGTLEGRMRTVPCDEPCVAAAPPPLLAWREVTLERAGDGWRGRVVAR